MDFIESTKTAHQYNYLSERMNNLGAMEHRLGRLSQAMKYYTKAVKMDKEILGGTNSHSSFQEKAIIESIAQEENLLIEQLKQKKQLREYPSENRWQTKRVLPFYQQRQDLVGLRKDQYRTKQFSQPLEIELACDNVQFISQTAIVTLYNMGLVHHELHLLDNALYMFQLAIEMYSTKSNPVLVAAILNNIAQVHYAQQRPTEAVNALYEALRHVKDIKNSMHTKTYECIEKETHMDAQDVVITTISLLGEIFYHQSDTKIALTYATEALYLRKSILGDNHSDVAASLYNIGLILYDSDNKSDCVGHHDGSKSEAIKFFSESLRVARSVCGENNQDVALLLCQIGDFRCSKGELDEALSLYKDALSIIQLDVEEKESHYANVLCLVQDACLEEGEIENAFAKLSEAIKVVDLLLQRKDEQQANQHRNVLISFTYSVLNKLQTIYIFNRWQKMCAPAA